MSQSSFTELWQASSVVGESLSTSCEVCKCLWKLHVSTAWMLKQVWVCVCEASTQSEEGSTGSCACWLSWKFSLRSCSRGILSQATRRLIVSCIASKVQMLHSYTRLGNRSVCKHSADLQLAGKTVTFRLQSCLFVLVRNRNENALFVVFASGKLVI